MECDHREKIKWKEYQPSRELVSHEINIQDEIWILFTNVPTRSGEKEPLPGRKISQNLVRYIEEEIYKPPLLQSWEKLAPLKK